MLDAFYRETVDRYRELPLSMRLFVFQFYKFFIYVPLLVVVTGLAGLLAVLVAVVSPLLASRWVARLWARILYKTTLSTLDIEGLASLDTGRSYVVVSNHLSQFDIPVLYGWLPLDLKWVMKKELRQVPAIGVACEAMGHIFLDRSNTEESFRVLQQVKGNLRPGTSILFFPEGTRSRNGKLQAFKIGAFAMAKDLDIAVLPVTVRHTDTILPPDGIDLRPGRARMIVHAPIEIDEVRALSAGELRDRARGIIAAPLAG